MQRSLLSWTSLKASIVHGYAGFGQPARTKAAVLSLGNAQTNQQVEYKVPSDTAILLIACDPAVRDAMCQLLEIEGFRVTTAKNVDEGLKQLVGDGVKLNLIITCYRLPGDNGIQAIQRMRCALKNPIPAILLTDSVSGEFYQAAKQISFRMLHIPVSADQLFNLINRLLKAAQETEQL